jgi:hypothetical protein
LTFVEKIKQCDGRTGRRPLLDLLSALSLAVTQPYERLLEQLTDNTQPFRTLTLQAGFIAYLVLGQFALLLVWQVLRGAAGLLLGRPWPRLGGALFALYLLAGQVAVLLAWPPLVSAAMTARPGPLLADVVVTSHLALVVAALLLLVLIVVGWPLGWLWTRNFWLRLAQLLVIEVVAGQAVVAIECPLTTVERQLRGGAGYLHDLDNASAVGRFCNETLFFDRLDEEGQPRKAFVIAYVGFGLLVVLTWVFVPPWLPWRPPGVGSRQ